MYLLIRKFDDGAKAIVLEVYKIRIKMVSRKREILVLICSSCPSKVD